MHKRLMMVALAASLAACGGGGGGGGSTGTDVAAAPTPGPTAQAPAPSPAPTAAPAPAPAPSQAPAADPQAHVPPPAVSPPASGSGDTTTTGSGPVSVPVGSVAAPPPVALPDPSTIPARSTVDRPDETSGPMVHIVYAVPSDSTDNHLDTNGVLENSIGSWMAWFYNATQGRKVRLDMVGNHVDITFVRMPHADADYMAQGWSQRTMIQSELQSMGIVKPGKVYLVYFEGGNNLTCADAPDNALGYSEQVAVAYLNGAVPGFAACNATPMAPQPFAYMALYREYTAIHELVHVFGAVSNFAPHAAPAGHVGDDKCDLMYQGPDNCGNGTVHVDSDHQDYFNPDGDLPNPLQFNLAKSPYLLPAPATFTPVQ